MRFFIAPLPSGFNHYVVGGAESYAKHLLTVAGIKSLLHNHCVLDKWSEFLYDQYL